jgi:hypothetical protein
MRELKERLEQGEGERLSASSLVQWCLSKDQIRLVAKDQSFATSITGPGVPGHSGGREPPRSTPDGGRHAGRQVVYEV